MASFTDNAGRQWSIAFTTGVLARLRTDAGIDLKLETAIRQIAEIDLYSEQFGRLLWVLVERQAAERGIEVSTFVDSLGGAALGEAIAAIEEALIDFFPNARLRKVASSKLPTIRAKIDADLERMMEEAVSKYCAGGSQGLSE